VLGFHKTVMKDGSGSQNSQSTRQMKDEYKEAALRNMSAQCARNCLSAVIAKAVRPVPMLISPQV